MTMTAIVALAVGTYALRLAGPLLRDRISLTEDAQQLLKRAAVLLLVAMIVISAMPQSNTPHGWALPAGVAIGGLLAWLKVPFAFVVIAAAGVVAGIRLLLGTW
ncbi:AzlD domain-containing protein [Natronoglycomyces albus]|uniref:AzlD domain-containing protein n=1 Tax=Natronoglycomyces albus TaxID=2811108 RepID=A0A895XHT1_9ACTN|nr:AzlD domain-containing protein [Natronoglycomyces albus]QSB04497.1 AzlD domain-containing protein [Natronoglycomyces albus]